MGSKYFLTKGKLELSMLDEEEDEFAEQEEISEELSLEDSKLDISPDVYNTLHSMAEFLTSKPQEEPEQEASSQGEITQELPSQEEVADERTALEAAFLKERQLDIDEGKKALEQGLSVPEGDTKNTPEKLGPSSGETKEILMNRDLLEQEVARLEAAINEEAALQKTETETSTEQEVPVHNETAIIQDEVPKEISAEEVIAKMMEEKKNHLFQQEIKESLFEPNIAMAGERRKNGITSPTCYGYYVGGTPENEVSQGSIDEIVKSFFADEKSRSSQTEDLKRHIDSEIQKIKNS